MTATRSATGTGPREFFIPDLCGTEPVMIMFILAELLVVVFVLGASELPDLSWGTLALASLFVQWVVLLCAGVLCALRSWLMQLSLYTGVVLSFVIIELVTLFSSMMARDVFAGSAYAAIDEWWVLRNLLVAAVFGGIALRYFYLQQQLREREQAELTARLESLRARIRPHFLFNTMNSIASLIGSRPEAAEQAVEDLSELFRANLLEAEQSSTLEDELHLCRLYMRIEQLRLGERLRVNWDIDEELLPRQMPPLILQPLVENAVYHGVARMAEGGTVDIVVRQRDDTLEIVVENPVPQDQTPARAGNQMAQDNIRQRVAAMFGDRGSCEVTAESGRYRVCLSYPLEPVQ